MPKLNKRRFDPQREFLVPPNLPDDLFPAGEEGELQRIVAYVLLDLIIHKTMRGLIAEVDEGMEFVALKHEYLQNQLPRSCRCKITDTWKRLRKLNIIETIGADRHAGKSMRFALTPEYCGVPRYQSLPGHLVKKEAMETEKRHRALKKVELPLEVHKWVETVMEDNLTIDLVRAELAAVEDFPEVDRRWSDPDYHFRQLMPVQGIAAGLFLPVVCRYGRIHHTAISLNKRFRSYLMLDGVIPHEWDVTACQPLLLFGLARDWTRMATRDKERFCQREFPGDPDRYPFRKDMRKGPCDVEEVERGVRLCEAGEFYEEMGDCMKTGIDTKVIKRLTLEMLFKPTGCLRASYLDTDGKRVEADPNLVALWKIFKKEFPTVAEMMVTVKKDNYCRLAWILQNAEATVMIDGVCKQIMTEAPETPVVPIHDAILCKPSDRQYVLSVMRDRFAKRHLAPKIK